MINKKQIYTVIISSILAISVTACNSGGGTSPTSQTSSATTQSINSSYATTSYGIAATLNSSGYYRPSVKTLATDSSGNVYVVDYTKTNFSVKTYDGSKWITVGDIIGTASADGTATSARVAVDKLDNIYVAYSSDSDGVTHIKKYDKVTKIWNTIADIAAVSATNYNFNFDSNNNAYLSTYSPATGATNVYKLDVNGATVIGSFIGLKADYDAISVNLTAIDPTTNKLFVLYELNGGTSILSQYDEVNNQWTQVKSFGSKARFAMSSTGKIIVVYLESASQMVIPQIYENGVWTTLNSFMTGADVSQYLVPVLDSKGEFYISYTSAYRADGSKDSTIKHYNSTTKGYELVATNPNTKYQSFVIDKETIYW